MNAQKYVNELISIKFEHVFNPYSDVCEISDRKDANKIRCANLISYLEVMEGNTDSIWLGRDLGYRGGRRTGLALTDEGHLPKFNELYNHACVSQATNGAPMSERTAKVVWTMLEQLPRHPFLWNIFPFHPYQPSNPMSNRSHTAPERHQCSHLVAELIEWLKPKKIVGIGNDSYNTLIKMGYDCDYVRHPSYGGQEKFVTGIRELHELTTPTIPQQGNLIP